MKTFRLLVMCLLAAAWGAGAATTINSSNNDAWGANIGWINWRGDVANGAIIGEYVCSGYIWGANVGWINLGNGTPVNGIRYQNNAIDSGVNLDAFGNLRGLAWGANIGWVNFHDLGAPKVDLKTGNFSGYAWGANVGWISLSNAFAYVRTDSIRPGVDSDGDGIADAWERLKFGNLVAANAASDADGDGFSDLNEYLAGTDPLDPASNLRITVYAASPGGSPAAAEWTSTETRYYRLWKTTDVLPTLWTDSGLGLITPDAGSSTVRTFVDPASPRRFYRIEAVRPLFP
jgi:hypothetical protein